MTEIKLEAENGSHQMKGNNASLEVKRGEKSNSYFIIVYNILLALLIGIISAIPSEYIKWSGKIFMFFLFALFLFVCFRVSKFRNFIVEMFSGIENYKEVSKLKSKKFYVLSLVLILIIFVIIAYHFHSQNNCSKTAIIPITGEIVSSPQYNSDGSVDKSDAIAINIIAQIRKAEKDNRVKAIVFVIDSPGGDSASAFEIVDAIKELKKPTVALIRSNGDSSAYLIASATGRIFALPTSGTGDIGITVSYTDDSIQNADNGITFHQLSFGKYKDMQNQDKPLTADEQKLIMSQVNEVANIFIKTVAGNRHLPLEKVQALADGSVILGQDALKDGLIDEIGSFVDVDRYLSQVLKRNVEMCISN